jgi:DNA modification methylase
MDVQLWQGDCIERMREIPDGSIDAVVTDPPYGIGYETPRGAQPNKNNPSVTIIEWGPIAGDEAVDGRWLTEAFRILRGGAALYLMTRWDVEPEWRALLRSTGFLVKQRLTWHKRVHGKGDLQGTYAPTCEDVLFATKGRHILNHRPSMLLDVGCVSTWEFRHHPHQKPVALPELLIKASTQPGNVVLDPFMGSGTTGLACLSTGRRFIGIESDPEHFETARAMSSCPCSPILTIDVSIPGGAADVRRSEVLHPTLPRR